MNRLAISLATIVFLAFTIAGCSDCHSELVSSARSPDGRQEASMSIRKCGSVEGWVVAVSAGGGEEREVFQARMPHPISVDDAKDVVRIRWEGNDALVIEAPQWAESLERSDAVGSVAVRYVTSDVAYPESGR